MKRFLLILPVLLAGAAFCEMGRLTVETEPPGARVAYSQPGADSYEVLGKTPINYVEFPEGVYQLLITLPDHDTVKIEKLAVFPGRHKKIFKQLIYSYAFLSVDTRPESSVVFLDDVKIGSCPYSNRLVLPGQYLLVIAPRDSLYKPCKRRIRLNKRDSLVIDRQLLFRSKTFESEHLGIPPWRMQLEAGFLKLSHTGEYDRAGGDIGAERGGGNTVNFKDDSLKVSARNYPSDSVKSRLLTPFILRLGLPQDIEFHLHLPFTRFNPLRDSTGPFGPGDLKIGVKYTLRRHNVGFDATYKLDNAGSSRRLGSGYRSLALSAMVMLRKKGFQFYGNAGYDFRFVYTYNPERKINAGDNIFAYLQAGYLMHPWMPYLSLNGDYYFADMWEGNRSMENGGHLLAPQVGVTVDAGESLGLQLGIPFTVLGKNRMKHWGVHFSLAYNVGVD